MDNISRVCLECIEEKFGEHDIIRPCPLSHDDVDLDEDEELECREGLHRRHLFRDTAAIKDLSRAKVYCDNRAYGCMETMVWKKLKVCQ